MYLRILKKDLKRKKTMNVILLVFILLASMFVASSVNNILTVSNGLDYFFEKAGMPDFLAMEIGKTGGVSASEVLNELEAVDSYGVEHILYLSESNVIYKGAGLKTKNTALLMAFEDKEINYFDENNEIIETLESGKVLVPSKAMKEFELHPGDSLEIRFGEMKKNFEIAGVFKDALLGSDLMGNTRFIISQSDFNELTMDNEAVAMIRGGFYYIHTSDTAAVKQALNEKTNAISYDMSLIRMSYVMNMVVAGVLLVVSILLILVAFVVLRFTIGFTLTEEFREIGVMKAIGIRTTKIRGLYMVKYFMLAVVGTVIGFFASIPFGNMLLQSVSETMVLGNEGALLINVLCSLFVVFVILFFCFSCTAKVKKFTPVDAIHSGTTGERFQKKGILRLKKSPGRPAWFLAANDVLSSPRRYGAVILTFTLCLSLLQVLATTVNTLNSGSLITTFGIRESDVFYVDDDLMMSFMVENGREQVVQELIEMEKLLTENGMPARCFVEVMFSPALMHGDTIVKAVTTQGIRTTADEYRYYEGTPPQNAGEIAMTPYTAKNLGVSIGDTVTIRHSFGEREYMLTALYQSMNNMGEGVRLHEEAEIDFMESTGCFAFQIEFTDNPDEKTLRTRIEQLKELFDTEEVFSAGEYVARIVGVAETMDSVRQMVMIITIIIVLLITMLIERSFITKERSEIAMLKAIGFRNRTIIRWHTIRFAIVSVIATILSLPLYYPLMVLLIGPVFDMMGADYGIEYQIIPLEVFVLYPLLVMAVTVLSANITARHTRKITASDVSGME